MLGKSVDLRGFKKILPLLLLFVSTFAYATPNSLWTVIRNGYELNHHTTNPRVQYFIRYYQSHPRLVHAIIQQSKPFLYLVVQQVKRQQLPMELALVPIIESAFHNTARSNVGASGAWQLMPGTAEDYQIQITPWYDGRQDIVKSTEGALSYLQYLHNYFDSNWLLAIAAYNAGIGTVSQAIKYNLARNLPTNFWGLNLPQQTELYVPKILAFSAIINNPARYGLQIPAVPNQPIVAPVFLPAQMNLSQAAHYAGISLKELQHLNPAYKRLFTPPKGHYYLILPLNHITQFEQSLAKNTDTETIAWREYRVQPGDTLSIIAQRTGASIATLMRDNRLYNTSIQAGETLLYPGPAREAGSTIIHIVKPGDTLSAIATRYGVSVNDLLQWNHLQQNSVLQIGERIVVR